MASGVGRDGFRIKQGTGLCRVTKKRARRREFKLALWQNSKHTPRVVRMVIEKAC